MTQEEIIKKAYEAFPDDRTSQRPISKSKEREGYIRALTDMSSKEIEKTARVSPGMLSNFGPSSFILDVELSQEEQSRLGIIFFGNKELKIKIICE